jgi:hypothetical protein
MCASKRSFPTSLRRSNWRFSQRMDSHMMSYKRIGRTMRSALLAGTLSMVAALHAQTSSSPISADPPPDSVNPASLVEIAVPSHGGHNSASEPGSGIASFPAGCGPIRAMVIRSACAGLPFRDFSSPGILIRQFAPAEIFAGPGVWYSGGRQLALGWLAHGTRNRVSVCRNHGGKVSCAPDR